MELLNNSLDEVGKKLSHSSCSDILMLMQQQGNERPNCNRGSLWITGDPQNYVSWDGIHATEAANKIIASAVIRGSYSYPPSKLCSP